MILFIISYFMNCFYGRKNGRMSGLFRDIGISGFWIFRVSGV